MTWTAAVAAAKKHAKQLNREVYVLNENDGDGFQVATEEDLCTFYGGIQDHCIYACVDSDGHWD